MITKRIEIFTSDVLIRFDLLRGLCTHLNRSKLTADRDHISDKAATDPTKPLMLQPVNVIIIKHNLENIGFVQINSRMNHLKKIYFYFHTIDTDYRSAIECLVNAGVTIEQK